MGEEEKSAIRLTERKKAVTLAGHLMLFLISRKWKTNSILSSLPHLCALLLEELGVYLLANDLGANVILDSDAKPHLFQDKLHLLLLLHGAICLHLDRNRGTFSKLTYFPLNKCGDICPD